jgi:hypothetical protein
MRKLIRMFPLNGMIYGLCDDGTNWYRVPGEEWSQGPEIPQDVLVPQEPEIREIP